MWSPADVGTAFDLSPGALSPLEPFRDYLTIVSNTDVRNAEAFSLPEIGADHFRSSAVFLTQSHPKKTQGSDVLAGTSLDQMYAQKFGQDTAIPSMQLTHRDGRSVRRLRLRLQLRLHRQHQLGDARAAAADDSRPARDFRLAVRRRRHAGRARAEPPRPTRASSTGSAREVSRLSKDLGAVDRAAPRTSTSTEIREIERRIQKIEAQNSSGEVRELPEAPVGVPDDFDEHVKLMFDLQVLAFASDMTRVFSFKMGRDGSARVYPESGVRSAFHPASHHGEREERVTDFMKINRYHVSMVPYFLKKLKETPDGDAATCSTTRWSSTARRWATRTCTTTSAARCSWPARPAARCAATCT